MVTYTNLIVEKKDAVTVVKINREKALNALNKETIDELQNFFNSHKSDDTLKAVIITGGGEKAFVAGADISELVKLDVKGGDETSARGLHLMATIQNFPKPIIAAVNGFALGGGCELAMSCDIRLASEKAKFGQPEVSLGIIPGYGGTQRLPRLVGRGKAMQLICTGDIIDAAEAHRIGLVDEVYPHDELMDNAMKMATKIASKGPIAIALAKDSINRGLDETLSDGCTIEKENFAKSCGTSDKNEGLNAFLEKRPAKFTSK